MTRTRKTVLCAVLTALALALSYLEHFIPLQLIVPLPGVKLGLANIVTLLCLYLLGSGCAFAVLVCRCVLGAVFGGSLSALLFSLTGGILAMSVMCLCKKMRIFSVFGVSILGAAAHNIGQIAVAMCLLGSVYAAAYLPYLLLVAVFTGFATGAACALTLRALKSGGVA